MPKMQRSQFQQVFNDLWERSQDNMRTQHFVAATLIGLDRMGRQVLCYGMDPESFQDKATRERLLNRGIMPVPLPWHEQAEILGQMFRESKVVAAVLLGEAWAVSGVRAQEMFELDTTPTGHPLREELIFVTALWPAEHMALHASATVTRAEEAGKKVVRLDPRHLDHVDLDDPNVQLVSWLRDILPQH